MSTTPQFRPVAAIVCDEIRQEGNAKEFFIGVYSNHIVVHKLPVTLGLQLHILGEIDAPGDCVFHVRISNVGEAGARGARAVVAVDQATRPHEQLGITMPKVPIEIAAEGELVISFKRGDDAPWEPLKTVQVLHRPRPEQAQEISKTAPSVPAQPS